MAGRGREIDVAKNLKTIEWLKAELAASVGGLFKALLKTGNDAVADALAAIIIVAYILGRRVGVSFQLIDATITSKLSEKIKESHEVEQWYGDLSDLQKYLQK
ncbi:MAG: hypothetical protein GXY16_02380 [Syntrophomonadaceae bacterium]|nr:hypothetical protein [Syntrophomonadaceae bacterium]